MTSLWVVDASPLIVLGKAGQLELLPKLVGKLVVPVAVVREVTVRKEEVWLMEFLGTFRQFQIEPNGEVCPEVLAWDLGTGESQAISMAARLQAPRVVLDDLEARRCAKSMNIRVIGSVEAETFCPVSTAGNDRPLPLPSPRGGGHSCDRAQHPQGRRVSDCRPAGRDKGAAARLDVPAGVGQLRRG